MYKEIVIDHVLIKIVGVFTYDVKNDIHRFIQNGYHAQSMIHLPDGLDSQAISKFKKDTEQFYKNVYYREYRGFLLTGEDIEDHKGKRRVNVKTFRKKGDGEWLNMSAIHKNKTTSIQVSEQEVFFFPGGIGMFALSLKLSSTLAQNLSDTIYITRDFNSNVDIKGNNVIWNEWISKEVLCDIPLVGKNVHADEFSGSKFKTYCIIDTQESQLGSMYQRDNFLYEIGTCSKLNSLQDQDYDAPSRAYLDEIMKFKFSIFHNYSGLTILDSMTVIGEGNFKTIGDDPNDLNAIYSYHNWNKTYFSIYIFNLFIKYNIFKFNAEFLIDPVGYRDQFQLFINNYNYHQISFNFLPNILYRNVRKGLEIDQEIEFFESRLTQLANQIQEEQERRQAMLLGFISFVTAFDAIDFITQTLNYLQNSIGLNPVTFYVILAGIFLLSSTFVMKYLFPALFNKIKKRVFISSHQQYE